MKAKHKILCFVSGVASMAIQELAAKAGAVIRNADVPAEGDYVERCDAVFGNVPKAYAEKPVLEEAQEEFDEILLSESQPEPNPEPEKSAKTTTSKPAGKQAATKTEAKG